MPVEYRWLTLKDGRKLGFTLTKVGNCVPCIVCDADHCEMVGLIEINGDQMLARVGQNNYTAKRIITDLSHIKALFKRNVPDNKERRARSNSRSRKA